MSQKRKYEETKETDEQSSSKRKKVVIQGAKFGNVTFGSTVVAGGNFAVFGAAPRTLTTPMLSPTELPFTRSTIPKWEAHSRAAINNAVLETNSGCIAGLMLEQYWSSPKKPPCSTVIDRSTNRYFWIDVNSEAGQLEYSKLYLCSDRFLYDNRSSLLIIAKDVHATALPIPSADSLPFGFSDNGKSVDFDAANKLLLSVLEATTRFPPPLQRLVADYIQSTTLLVGLVYYPESDYVNVAAFGSTEAEIYDKTLNQLGWTELPNKLIEVEIFQGPIDSIPSDRPLVNQRSVQINICRGETSISYSS